MPSSFYLQLVAVLARYMSGINAHSVVGRSVRQASLDEDRLSARDIPVLMATLDRGLRRFVEPDRQAMVLQELDALAGPHAEPSTVTVVIRSEPDISQARVIVKQMCERLGFKSYVTQRAATRVSEFARNIVSYTPGASIEISRGEGDDIKLTVRGGAVGIPNFDEVLSGRYRSASPFGGGLAETKRRADQRRATPGASRDIETHRAAWERFWMTLDRAAGPAFWDVEPERGALLDLPHFKELFDPNLPIVDLGCGDGRQTRALAEHWPRVVGVDISENAIAQARALNPSPGVVYSPLDALNLQSVAVLHGQLGDACVYMRGLLLHLASVEREACARGVETLLGAKGTLYLIEPSPGFSGSIGAPGPERPATPPAVRQVLERGIPVEGVGPGELAALFPASRFEVLASISTALEAAFEAPEGGFARLPAIAWVVRRRAGDRQQAMRARRPASDPRGDALVLPGDDA